MKLQSLLPIVLALSIGGFGPPVLAADQPAVLDAGADIPGSPAALIADARAAMAVDPDKAGRAAQAAEVVATKLPPSRVRTVTLAKALWLRGEALLRLDKAAAAAPLIEAALKSVAAVRPAIKLEGDLLQTRAGIESSLGQPQAALADYQRAHAIFSGLGAARSQAVSLQNIGSIYLEANDLDKATYYYRQAEETFPNDPMLTLSGSANVAGALYAAKRFDATEKEYRRAYLLAQKLHNPTFEIQLLSNLARTQRVLGKLDAADQNLAQAIRLWQATKAAALEPMLFQTRAELALARDRPTAAVAYVERALAAAGDAASTRPYWQLQYTAYRIYAQTGDPAKALAHFEIYQQLDNQSRELAASTSAALMAARFDFANQNARIATLKAGALERDIALARLQARQNLIVLGSLLLISISVAAVLAYHLRSLGRSRNEIRQVNEQLTAANAELHDALAAKSQFLATTSHEIRTPLNGILGMTQVLLADRTLTGVLRERIALMQGAGETMRALVDDILDFAKMDAGKLELHPLETELPRLLDELIEFWRDRAAQQGLVLTFDRGAVPERVMLDSRRLRQILANLLSNAIKFTPAGSVVLTVTTVAATTSEGTANASSGAAGDRLRIAVTDTGIGIGEADQLTVFEKFRQLDSGTTRRFGGTGLGLAISQMLAQAMGGDIELSSTAGAGSTFTLDLPLVRAVVAEASSVDRERPATLATARLVLVGSSPIAQGVLRAVLTPRVASFALASDIPSAIACMEARSTDLVIVDIAGFGDAEGEVDRDAHITALTAAAEAASRAAAALVVLWPNRLAVDHDRLLAAGMTAVIGKPVTSVGLTGKLAALFETAGDGGGPIVAAPLELATT